MKEASQSQDIVLVTLPFPAKEDPKGKGLTSSATVSKIHVKATAKDNPPSKTK